MINEGENMNKIDVFGSLDETGGIPRGLSVLI